MPILLFLIITAIPILATTSGMALAPLLILLMALVIANNHTGLKTTLWQEQRALWIIVSLIALWPLLNSLWSFTPRISIISSIKVTSLMIAGVLAVSLCRLASRGTALAFVLCLAAIVLLVVPSALLSNGFDYKILIRYHDKSINRGLCALTILVWPAVLALASCGKTRLANLLPLLLIIPLFMLHSLSAKMGLMAGMVVFYGTLVWPRILPKVVAVIVLLFFLGWPLIFHLLDLSVFANPQLYDALPDSSQHRLRIWRFVLDNWAQKPWVGWGMDTSRSIPGGHVEFRPGMVWLPLHPHNSVLHILLEQGLIGLCLTLGALAMILRRWINLPLAQPMRRATAGALIVSYLTIGFTAFGVWQLWWLSTAWIAAILWTMFARRMSAAG